MCDILLKLHAFSCLVENYTAIMCLVILWRLCSCFLRSILEGICEEAI